MASQKKPGLPKWVYVVAPLGALVAMTGYTCASTKIVKTPSGSMMPTLLAGDRVAMKRSAAITRGEVILHRFPENKEQLFIKRIVALPGETLEVVAGRPVINGKIAPRCYVGPYPTDADGAELYIEFLGDFAYGTLFNERRGERTCATNSDCRRHEDTCTAGVCGEYQGPYKVGPDEVWVLGDNRDNSHDSRSWRGGLGGGVPKADVIGSARLVLFAFKPAGGSDSDRNFTSASGPPALPASLKGTLGPAIDKCLRERPAADKIPK